MKTELVKNEFEPFEINIRLDSVEEAAAFYAVFNYTPIVEVLESSGMDNHSITGLRSCLKTGANKGDSLPYSEYHESLCAVNK